MKRILLAAVIAVAGAVRGDGIEQGVAEALAIVQQRNLKVDDVAVRKAVVVAVARSVDPGAEVFSESEAVHRQEEAAGSDFGAGFRLGITNGLPVVLDVTAEGPAAKVGVVKGDIITGIGSDDAFDVMSLPDALRATRGHGGEKLVLQVRRGAMTTNLPAITLSLQRLAAIELAERLPNSILYLKVNGLFAGGGEAVAAELRGWTAKSRSGVVLDLRAAGGDDLQSAGVVAGLFAKEGDVLFTLGGDAGRVVAGAGSKPMGVPVMVLVDDETHGAAELLAAVLADSVKGAMLVGRTTKADPLVREYVKLQSGDRLYLATRQLVTADGSRYDGRNGVKPDVVVNGAAAQAEYDAEPAADHRRALMDQELQDFALRNRIRGDAVLRRAVDILLGLKALNIGAGGAGNG